MNLILSRFIPKHWVSRSKTLLKRRKIAIKKRPISARKLKEQAKLFNYAKQYRALQIQKQLDRRSYSSQHINQLMDEIFYPDVTLANEEAAKIHLQASMLRQYNFEEEEYADEVEKQIKQRVLATELIEFYNQNKQVLEMNHLIALFSKMAEYFNKRDRIKQRIQRKWKRMNQTLKKKDKDYKQKKCPYIFIDKEDTFHFKLWNQMMDDLINKIQSKLLGEQSRLENMLGFSQIITQIYRGISYIPLNIYSVFENYLSAISPQQIQQLKLPQCSQILHVIGLKQFIRLPIHNIIRQKQDSDFVMKINTNKIILVDTMLMDPKITVQQIQTIIKSISSGSVNFNEEIQEKLRLVVLGNLSQISYERIVELFEIYVKNGEMVDLETMELLKFDLLRKSITAFSKDHLFKCLQFANNKYITFSMPSFTPQNSRLYAYDLFLQTTKTILSKYCGLNNLTFLQILKLVGKSYNNSLTDISLLELISSEIVKLRDQFKLNQLTESVFKIYLLGYRSPVLTRILFEEQKKRYQDAKKRIKQEQVLLIQGQADPKKVSNAGEENNIVINPETILEEDLIISLWLLFLTHDSKQGKKFPASVDELMKIYPLSTYSKHPLIYQIVANLNAYTKSQGVLFAIKCLRPTKQYEKYALNNRLNVFYELQPRDTALKSMKKQANISGKFLHNYDVEDKKFIPEVWSKTQAYIVDDYIKWVINNSDNEYNYFNKQMKVSEDIKNLRKEIVAQQRINEYKKTIHESKPITSKEQYEIYRMD